MGLEVEVGVAMSGVRFVISLIVLGIEFRIFCNFLFVYVFCDNLYENRIIFSKDVFRICRIYF